MMFPALYVPQNSCELFLLWCRCTGIQSQVVQNTQTSPTYVVCMHIFIRNFRYF